MDEIHAPVLIRRRRPRHRPTMQAQAFAPTHSHRHLQPFQPIQPVHALAVDHARRASRFLLERQMHARSWRPFCCGWPGLMRSIAMPSRNHPTDSLERWNRALGLAKGTPLSDRRAPGRPRSRKSCSKAVMAVSSRVDSSASHISRNREA